MRPPRRLATPYKSPRAAYSCTSTSLSLSSCVHVRGWLGLGGAHVSKGSKGECCGVWTRCVMAGKVPHGLGHGVSGEQHNMEQEYGIVGRLCECMALLDRLPATLQDAVAGCRTQHTAHLMAGAKHTTQVAA